MTIGAIRAILESFSTIREYNKKSQVSDMDAYLKLFRMIWDQTSTSELIPKLGQVCLVIKWGLHKQFKNITKRKNYFVSITLNPPKLELNVFNILLQEEKAK